MKEQLQNRNSCRASACSSVQSLGLLLFLFACSPPGEGYRSQPVPEGQTTFVSPGNPDPSTSRQSASRSELDAPIVESKTEALFPASSKATEVLSSPHSPVQTMILNLKEKKLNVILPEMPQQNRRISRGIPSDREPSTPHAGSRPTPAIDPNSVVETSSVTDANDLTFQKELAKSEMFFIESLKKFKLRVDLANKGEAKTPRQIEAAHDREESIRRHQGMISDEIMPAHEDVRRRLHALTSPTLPIEAKATEQQRALDNITLLIKRVGEIDSSLAQDIARINIDLIMDEQVRNNGID